MINELVKLSLCVLILIADLMFVSFLFRRTAGREDHPPRYYITGSTNRDLQKLIRFCKKKRMTEDDVIIVLGGADICSRRDTHAQKIKKKLAHAGVTLLNTPGSEKRRPREFLRYRETVFNGGPVYYEPGYPNLFYAKEGGAYEFYGKTAIATSGGSRPETKKRFEKALARRGGRVDYIFAAAPPAPGEQTAGKWFCSHAGPHIAAGDVEPLCRRILELPAFSEWKKLCPSFPASGGK